MSHLWGLVILAVAAVGLYFVLWLFDRWRRRPRIK
jgi:hypothetical protein